MNPRETHIAKCQSLYNALRESVTSPPDAPTYIRAVFETSRCDDVRDYSAMRDDHTKFISRGNPDKQTLSRILSYKETPEDEKRALQSCLHYRHWHSTLYQNA